jgi:hypothetical protein
MKCGTADSSNRLFERDRRATRRDLAVNLACCSVLEVLRRLCGKSSCGWIVIALSTPSAAVATGIQRDQIHLDDILIP